MKNYLLNKQIRLDKLFNDKLATLEIHPSDNPWNRVQAGLQAKTKKNRITWFAYVAAAIIVLITATITWNTQFATVPAFEQMRPETAQSKPEYNRTPQIKTTIAGPVVSGNKTIREEFSKPPTHMERIPAMHTDKYYASSVVVPVIEVTAKVLTGVPYEIIVLPERSGFDVETGIVLATPAFIRKPVSDLPVNDTTPVKKAFEYISKVKNGEEKLLEVDLVKARKDLFAMARNVRPKSETQPLN